MPQNPSIEKSSVSKEHREEAFILRSFSVRTDDYISFEGLRFKSVSVEVRIMDMSGNFPEVMGVMQHQNRLDSAFGCQGKAYVFRLRGLTAFLADLAVLSSLLCSVVSYTVIQDAGSSFFQSFTP